MSRYFFQVLAARFVQEWLLLSRTDSASWHQLQEAAQDAVDSLSELRDAVDQSPALWRWLPRSEAEVRFFLFGFIAGVRVKTDPAARAKLADQVLKEAKLLPFQVGGTGENQMVCWVCAKMRPVFDVGFSAIATEQLVDLFLKEHLRSNWPRRRLEMEL